MNTDNFIIHSDGTVTAVKPKDFKRYTLEELQSYVGGFIEVIHLTEDRLLVVNEDGKLNKLSVNDKATILAHQCKAIGVTDFIVGDAVFIESKLFD